MQAISPCMIIAPLAYGRSLLKELIQAFRLAYICKLFQTTYLLIQFILHIRIIAVRMYRNALKLGPKM